MANVVSMAGADTLFHALISTAVDGIMVIDERGLVQVYNKACEKLFGYTAEEVLGQNVKMLMPAPFRQEHDGYISRYKKTREARIIGIGREVVGQRKDGTTFPMYLSVGEGVAENRRIFVGIVSDLTERHERQQKIQELQSELLHVARLTDMGQLSSAMAHELNQPLTSILNYANAAHDIAAQRKDGTLEKVTQRIIEQTSRAGAIIRRLRAFVEKRETNQTLEDLPKVIEEAIALAQLEIAERGVRLHLDAEWKLPQVSIDRVQIQQVLINLLRNAVEAMQGSERRELSISVRREGDELLRVALKDTGSGIPKSVMERLFQPFVTTKEKGMGLGLTICRQIIEAHRGQLWPEANPDGGTVFNIRLPIAKRDSVNA